jgi:hypothetical protein
VGPIIVILIGINILIGNKYNKGYKEGDTKPKVSEEEEKK